MRAIAILGSLHLFLFQGLHERFTRGIVPGVRLAAHTDVDAVRLQQIRVLAAGILHAAIGVMHQTRLYGSLPQRHVQRGDRQRSVQSFVQMPADHASRIRIQNHRKIDELLLEPDVGDVGDPELIDTAEDHRARPIRIDF